MELLDGFLSYWGGGPPAEVIWALNDLLKFAKRNGFDDGYGNVSLFSEETTDEAAGTNIMLSCKLSEFLKAKIERG